MKTLMAAIVGLCAVVIFILLRLPWGTRGSRTQPPARFNFLLVLGVVVMGMLLLVFWFAMRTRWADRGARPRIRRPQGRNRSPPTYSHKRSSERCV